jgi:hypothetical protein
VVALDIAFGQQVFIRQNHGRARHAEPRCHGSGGRHARARTARPGQHGGAHQYVDLPRERRAARLIELPSVEVGPSAQCHRKNGPKWSAIPTTSPGGRTALFFTNDEGLYVLDVSAVARKLREIETVDERTKLLETCRAQRREFRRGRLDIPRRVPPMSGHDLWDSNQPARRCFSPYAM